MFLCEDLFFFAKQRNAFQCKLSTGCSILDACLGGGLACGNVTEIVGESSVGKTQLCLQLALQVDGNQFILCSNNVRSNEFASMVDLKALQCI